MKTKFISIIALAAMTLCGCSHLLDIEQHGVQDFDHYYTTDEEADAAINAAYIDLRGNYYNIYMLKTLLSDDVWAGGGGRNDNSDLEKVNEYNFDTEHSFLQGSFEGYYKTIYKANVVIAHCTADTDIMKRSVAEAKVIRAMQYFDLITLWGNPPLVDHELTPDEYSKPNGTTEELWTLVNTDLEDALKSGYLTEKASAGDKTWRVTKQFAQALYGKALLWQGKNKEAADMLEQVISSKKYELYPEYEDIYLYSNKMSNESLFESVRITNPSNGFENFTFVHLMTHWRTDHMTMTQAFQDRFVLQQSGYGFLCPKLDLYEDFVKEEGKNGYRLNATLRTQEQMKEIGMEVSAGTTVISEGIFDWKHRVEAAAVDPSSFAFSCENDHIWMRYAEVLLLAAEANLAAGNQGKADQYLNQVRSRAKLASKSNITLKDIQIEKRLELCYDLTRYQDLLRWGLAEERLKDQGGSYPVLSPNGNVEYLPLYDGDHSRYGWKKGKHEFLPYPGIEVRLNKNIHQNPGWE